MYVYIYIYTHTICICTGQLIGVVAETWVCCLLLGPKGKISIDVATLVNNPMV